MSGRQPVNSRQKRLRSSLKGYASHQPTAAHLTVLAVFPICVILALELNGNSALLLGTNIRVYNAVDMMLLTPFYHFLLGSLVRSCSLREWELLATNAMIAAFLSGRAVHCSADAIHSFAVEVRDYGDQLPRDLKELMHTVDEDIGHILIFPPYFVLLALLTLLERPPVPPSRLVTAIRSLSCQVFRSFSQAPIPHRRRSMQQPGERSLDCHTLSQ